jgi:anti-sigma factor RsiW
MNALDEPDRARFDRHLRRCDACAQEVSGLRETAARLGSAAATPAPPAMKATVLAAARQTRQQAPVVRERRRLALIIAMPVAVAATAAAVVLGVTGVGQQGSGTVNSTLAAVMTAKDAQMMTGQVSGGGKVTVVMSHQARALVFTAADLRGPGSYQLWLVGPGGHRMAAAVTVGAHGMAGPVVATGLSQGDHLMLMAEPSGSAVLDLRL